jgi:hypothetical protein
LTAAQRREAAATAQKSRIETIIYRAMAPLTVRELALKAGLSPNVLYNRLGGKAVWDVPTITAVADAISLDDKTRAALLGSKTKCRFEHGYRDGEVCP